VSEFSSDSWMKSRCRPAASRTVSWFQNRTSNAGGLAEQVVVDDVVPDEVVRPQPGEHAAERLAVQVAAPGGLRDRRRRDLAARERRGGAGARVVERGDEQGQARDLAQAPLGGQVADDAGADDPARAGSCEMDARLPRDRSDRVARLEHRLRVRVEIEVALLGARVAPGDHEHLLALLHEPLGHAAAGSEVEHVVLVDRRRREQQRHLTHPVGLRRVLDQLEDVGSQHDRAGSERQVLTDRELACVDRGG